MPKYLFYKRLFTIQCILENKIEVISLANTCGTRYGFINKKFIEKVYQIFEIEP